MRKYLLLGFILSSTGNLVAQNKKIIGTWKEYSRLRIDTLASAYDEMLNDRDAYVYGAKQLSWDQTSQYIVYPENVDSGWEISITEEKDGFWVTEASDWGDWKRKFLYDPETNRYYVTMKKLSMRRKNEDWMFTVVYDLKTQHLLFIEMKTGTIHYEFIRKK